MASLEGENAQVTNKFNGKNFNLWKSKLKLGLIFMDLWDIMVESEAAPPPNSSPKVKKEY